MGGIGAEEDKIQEELDSWKCHKCGRPGYKTDGHSRVWCERCLGMNLEEYQEEMSARMKIQPLVRSYPKQGRNDLCNCGSGKKYKKCCLPVHKVPPELPESPSALKQVLEELEQSKIKDDGII
jgi:hypothetical protein